MARRTIVAALGALVLVLPIVAHAQAPPAAQRAEVYSAYERQTIDDALRDRGEKVAPNPEGKLVERVDVVRLDVFEPRDPLPQWLNIFHATTRPRVVEREVLLHEGDPYRQVLVDETIRNLRQLPQLSAVLIVATAGSDPEHVGLLVITKDVWSLRASWDIVVASGGLEEFELHPEERNLLGTHQDVSATFIYEPSAYTLGLGYIVPRIATSRVALVADANIMVNRATGSPEGSYGSLVAGQPLYSGVTEWAWNAATEWQDIEARRYVNAQLSHYVDSATKHSVPFEYRAREYIANYALRRSFGWDTKHDFTLSAGINSHAYRTDFPGADSQTAMDFRKNDVPVSDTRVGPAIEYETYTKRYVRVIDFDTLALQEDYRLGHDIVLAAAPSFRALGSSRDVLSLSASAQYTFALRDGLFRVSFVSVTEPETNRIADASIHPGAHLVTPTIAGLGRIVIDGTMRYRWRNYLNATTYLGGGDRLRGYPTQYFVGQDFVSYNVELRSRPVEILSCQLAMVGFFDAGDAFRDFRHLQPVQSLGFGVRALFPQLDRGVFRADLGFPIERPIDPATRAPIAPFAFLVSFGQAFDVPTVTPTPVLPTEQVEVPGVAP